MNCKKCNAELQDDALFCPECMDRFAVEEQKAKFAEASKASKNTVMAQLKNVMFLVVAICFSVMFVNLTISMFTGGISGIFTNLLPFIFMLIALIGHWTGYTAKEGTDIEKVLRRISIYDAYNSVMSTIGIVLTSIVGAILVIVAFVGGGLLSGAVSSIGGNGESKAADDALAGGLVAGIIVLIILAIVITVEVIIRNIYRNRRRYFVKLGASVTAGSYNIEKAPIVGSFVVGIFSILSAISSFTFSAVVDSFLSGLVDALAKDIDGLAELVEPLLDGMAVSLILSGVGSLVIGGYYIVSALWIKTTHEEQLKNGAAVAEAKAALEKVEAETNEAIRNLETLKKKEAEDEAKKAQAAMQEQQMMMQQMMMQMMQQQQAAAATQAAPVAEEAPVEEVDPMEADPADEAAEEAPVEEAPAADEATDAE